MEFIRKKPLTVSDMNKEGFKVSYDKLKRAINECEYKSDKHECKRILKDLGIEVIDSE